MMRWMLVALFAVFPAQAEDNAVERGLEKAGKAVERGLDKAGKAIERGAKAAGRAVDRGAKTVQKGAAGVHKKVDEKVRPRQ